MNPFTEDVFSGKLSVEQNLSTLYREELKGFDHLLGGLAGGEVGSGQIALLLSPAAGAGKSHFLARLQAESSSRGLFLPLVFDDPAGLRWDVWLRRGLIALHETADGGDADSRTVLTGEIARMMSRPLGSFAEEEAASGDLPPGSADWLRERGRELFDGAEPPEPPATWARGVLSDRVPVLASQMADALGLENEAAAEWLKFYHGYASLWAAPGEPAARLEAQRRYLAEAEILRSNQSLPNCGRDDLKTALRLLTQERPAVLLMDDLDWLYRDENTALGLARMFLDFAKLVPRSLTIVSLNRDNWDQTFETGLPEAVRDRLTTQVRRLLGVSRTEWQSFLETRARAAGAPDLKRLSALCDHLDRGHASESTLMPRRLLRAAAELWTDSPAREKASSPIFSKPQTATPPLETASPSADPVPAPAPRWVDAMGDLKKLIRSRASQEPLGTSQGETLPLAPSAPSAPSLAKREPGRKPELTPEFQSFISGLRGKSSISEASPPGEEPPALPEAGTESEESSPEATGTAADHSRPEEDVPTAAPPQSNGTAHADTDTETHSDTVATSTRPRRQPVTPGWVAARLRDIKMDLAQAPLGLELTVLRRLIHTAGERFPAISQEVTGSRDDPAGELRWRFQQSEVNFGFHPYQESDTWRRLVADTARRARELREREKTRVKLVSFSRRAGETILVSWKLEEQDSADLQFCDVLILSDHQLASIYAVDRLLSEETDPERHDAVFVHVSGELNFFWKMITRPVWTLVSQLKPATNT